MISVYDFNAQLNEFEKGLNVLGYIPVLGSVTGIFRMAMGTIVLITGVALEVLGQQLVRTNPESKMMEIGINYQDNGNANITRGLLELLPGMSICFCLPYDLLGIRVSYITQPPKKPIPAF